MPTGGKGMTIMKKTIIMQNEATMKAEGKLNSAHCKPVICIDDGRTFTSVTDAAEQIGVAVGTMCGHLQGRYKSCNGYHLCYLSAVTENLDTIVTHLRQTSKDSEDARKWREYQAEQEALRIAEEKRQAEARKAEEQRQAKIAKLRERVAKYNDKCNDYTAKLNEAMNMKDEVERELESLLGEDEVA